MSEKIKSGGKKKKADENRNLSRLTGGGPPPEQPKPHIESVMNLMGSAVEPIENEFDTPSPLQEIEFIHSAQEPEIVLIEGNSILKRPAMKDFRKAALELVGDAESYRLEAEKLRVENEKIKQKILNIQLEKEELLLKRVKMSIWKNVLD